MSASHNGNVEKEEEKINRLAKEYWEAKQNSYPERIKQCRDNLVSKFFGESCKLVKEKYIKAVLGNMYFNVLGYGNNEQGALDWLYDHFLDMLDKYNYSKNDNFVAFCLNKDIRAGGAIVTLLSTDLKKYIKEHKIDGEYIQSIDFNISEDGRTTIGDTIQDESKRKTEERSYNEELLSKLPLLIININEMVKGRANTPKKKICYRVFVTGYMADIIQEKGVHIFDHNRNEADQAIDGKYIKFVSFTDYKCLEDIITMEMKTYGDIGVPNAKKGTVIKLLYDPLALIEYRFRYFDNSKRVSRASISQQHTAFVEQIITKLKDII